MKNIAIILASGTGERAGLNIPKQFYKIKGKTVLEYSIEAFENNKNIDEIVVVSNPKFLDLTDEIIKKAKYKKIRKILAGGNTRQESSYNGVFSIEDEQANVLIHDAVRPFVTNEIINECIYALEKYNAVNVAIESSDTIIQINDDDIITALPERKYIRRCQTPQCFNLRLIKKAHYIAKKDAAFTATDDCGLVLRYNLAPIYVIDGDVKNIKITYPSDITLAEEYLEERKKEEFLE